MPKIPEDQQYPTIVYKSPGDQSAPDGVTYKFKGVDKEVDLENAISDGWSLSLEEACGLSGQKPDHAPVNQLAIDLAAQEAIDSGPPTRPELEAQAASMKLQTSPEMSDAELEQLIGEKLADSLDASDSPSGTEADKQRKLAEKQHQAPKKSRG